jgi:hypothetical protein
MTIIAGSGGDTSKYPSVPIGVHKARCVRIIDLGTQKNEYQGQNFLEKTGINHMGSSRRIGQ